MVNPRTCGARPWHERDGSPEATLTVLGDAADAEIRYMEERVKASEVRRMALSLPETEEREAWGAPTFRTKSRIFVSLDSDGQSASVKARKEHQHSIVASDPTTFSVAPYVGRFGWISVELATVDPQAMRVLIVDAWRRTAPKRTVAVYDAQG